MYHILVCDDEKDIVSALKFTLRPKGMKSLRRTMASRRCKWLQNRKST